MPALPFDRRVLIAGIVVGTTLIVGWAFSGAFTSQAARECARLYRVARTAADTVQVEATIPAGDYQTREPRSCKSLRTAARWFVIR